ncbi:MAG: hypothetical protein R3293_26240 [Candidatus Promineifilaceae bacterium]|nr:hypothetical protein [Candidatus Promineifilaceae bacterium]
MDKQRKQPQEKERAYQWLLMEASWQEFWHSLDQLVDWNKKREEWERLCSHRSPMFTHPPDSAQDGS